MALAGMSPAPVPTGSTIGTVVTVPAAPAQQQQRAPARAISARHEIERVDDLFYAPRRPRGVWDGKNRTSGDRAHKRLKQRRRRGR
jgi:hypothetical protein